MFEPSSAILPRSSSRCVTMNRDKLAPPKRMPQQNALTKALSGAVERIQVGRLDEAVKVLESNGGLALKNPVGRNILGDIHLKRGKPREALRAFDAALAMAPSFPEAHSNRGVALQEMGRLDEALAAEERALRHRPNYAMAHYNRGNILKDLGRLDEALTAYDRALKVNRAFTEARLNRGMALVHNNRAIEALADLRRAIALQPDLVGAHLGLAAAHQMLSQRTEALAAIEAALAIAPRSAEALVFKSGFLAHAERLEEALQVAEEAIGYEPTNPSAHSMRSTLLGRLKRFDESLAEADEAIRLAPKEAEGHAVRAMALSELARVEEQFEALKTAERLGAASHTFYHARAIALTDLGDLANAAASYERAIDLAPDAAQIHHHYAMLLISVGDFQRGLAEHEWRIKDHDFRRNPLLAIAPMWRGEDLNGKKILMFTEQGHGDTIQFVRFVPQVVAMNATVALIASRPLHDVLRRALPAVDIDDGLGLRSGFDHQVPLMSLPHVLGTNLETLPRGVPYLLADQARVAKWRERIGSEGFKVGIAWQGNPDYHRDRYRSIPLSQFAPLAAMPGVRLISVQAIHGLEQLDGLPDDMKVESFGTEIANNPDGFDEVAGLMSNLDLMITSDTSAAHFAGALGRPIWVALHRQPDWRWMRERVDSPWYPTMRLFRQKTAGDWPGVFAEIAPALERSVAGSASPHPVAPP